jgi:hypothetical protein
MKLTIDRKGTLIFKSLGGPQVSWCEGCGAEAPLMNVTEAAREAGLDDFAIYKLLNKGAVHFTEDPERHVLICLNSLFK